MIAQMASGVPKRLAVLVSGAGTNLQALLDGDDLGGAVTVVVSDRSGAAGLERARRAGIEAVAVEPAGYADRASWEGALVSAVAAGAPDLVVLAGFLRILSRRFVDRWPVLNVHPSLLPAFPGAHAVDDALAYGVKVTGATVHFVDEQVDHGPIVAQRVVEVRPGDDAGTLHDRIQRAEHEVLPACVRLFCSGRLTVDGRHVRIAE
ncbi:MAG: phosphoribosylglycinamide formyltransferase [Euzebyaceae bacterium]|jgi:phosphoribosylglycinamide formyltransferase-1|nr:phosphoribosylglycinamide formyltransferase [Euzebyaceae bacterium]